MEETLKSKNLAKAQFLRESGYSYRAISKKLGVSTSHIYGMLNTFEALRRTASKVMPPMVMKDKKKTLLQQKEAQLLETEKVINNLRFELEKARAESLQAQADKCQIERELDYQRLRADAYNEMINIAEDKFKIAIRKKAGAKR